MAKHIRSDDPRKKAITDALKRKVPCDKVTLLEERQENGKTIYRGHCLKYTGRVYQALGYFEISAWEVALVTESSQS